MSSASIGLDDRLQQYLLDVSLHEPAPCARLRERTLKLRESMMISSPEQVQLLALLCGMLGARRGLEIGTFTGYTTLRLTLGLPELRMTCCDVSEEFTAIAREHWREAGVENRVEVLLGPADKSLAGMLDNGQAESYDFAYIDADKGGYRTYAEACLQLVRGGGLVMLDNVLWSGMVADPSDDSEDTEALREVNAWLHEQAPGRFDLSLIPIGDGLTLLRKIA
jgi:predicted O-methyltransferase YrrM